MGLQKSKLGRSLLERLLSNLKPISESRRPIRGWLRATREALGMSGVQLARRMGVQQPRIIEMEKAEVAGALTLKSLERAAEAMGCTLAYALVPKAGSLDETLRIQARAAAIKRRKTVSHSIKLEDQDLSVEESAILDAEVEDALRDLPKWIWE